MLYNNAIHYQYRVRKFYTLHSVEQINNSKMGIDIYEKE